MNDLTAGTMNAELRYRDNGIENDQGCTNWLWKDHYL